MLKVSHRSFKLAALTPYALGALALVTPAVALAQTAPQQAPQAKPADEDVIIVIKASQQEEGSYYDVLLQPVHGQVHHA